ncbi:hypothetical protein OC861_001128 [Tilletia horrida]|nr:hypothetical protein OC861_001128 [Tilletia horrida]
MHASITAILSLSLVSGFAAAANIKCSPYYTGQFLAFEPDFETTVPAGFVNGVTDPQGRKIVAISNAGKAPNAVAMTFHRCSSKYMPSGVTSSKAADIYYGIVTPAHHTDKCLTLSSVRKASGPTYVVSSTCNPNDTVEAQLPQWFSLTEQGSFKDPNVLDRYVSVVGSPNTTSTAVNYGFYSLQAFKSKNTKAQLNGKLTFLEYVWTPTYNGMAYTFGLGKPL